MTMVSDRKAIQTFILEEWSNEQNSVVQAVAADIAAKFAEPPVGILFYGSCIDQADVDGVLDFYVIVSRYDQAYVRKRDVWLNRVLPPNVYYYETDAEPKFRAKYAVLSLADLSRLTSKSRLSPTIWARFAQPTRLVFSKNVKAKSILANAVVQAMETALLSVRPLLVFGASSEDMWVCMMRQSYRTELRVETAERAAKLFDRYRERYEAITPLLLRSLGLAASQAPKIQLPRGPKFRAQAVWWLRRVQGKLKSLVLLSKATLTFKGGLDYLAWKIERHSGRTVTIKPWMRRVPVIAGLMMALHLRLEGTIR